MNVQEQNGTDRSDAADQPNDAGLRVVLISTYELGHQPFGLASPAAWLRGDLEPFARETLSPGTIRRQGYLRPEAVTRGLDDHVAGHEDLSRQLWGLLAFTLWHERHVEGIRRDVSLAQVVV